MLLVAVDLTCIVTALGIYPCDKINLDLDLIDSTHVAKVKGFKCLQIQ